MNRWCTGVLAAAMAGVGWIATAEAHPHVWVESETTVLFDNGNVSGLRQKWSFDEYYTEMAITGLDKNGDGIYSREELQELADTNIEGMKDFQYFTYANYAKKVAAFAAPTDYYLEYKDKILSLYFTLPLAQPVPAKGSEFVFMIDDPSFLVAFSPGKGTTPLGPGAPAGCKLETAAEPQDEAEAKRLQDAFGGQLSGAAAGFAPSGMAKQTKLVCP